MFRLSLGWKRHISDVLYEHSSLFLPENSLIEKRQVLDNNRQKCSLAKIIAANKKLIDRYI